MIRAHKLFLLSTLVFGAVAISACGDDDGTTSPGDTDGGNGGVDAATLGSLTRTQYLLFCKETQVTLRDVTDLLADAECTKAGVLGASAGSDPCETTLEACLELAEGRRLTDTQIQDGCKQQWANSESAGMVECPSLTVGEMRTCFKARKELYAGVYADLTCDTAAGDLPERPTTQPEACTKLADKCPSLAGSN